MTARLRILPWSIVLLAGVSSCSPANGAGGIGAGSGTGGASAFVPGAAGGPSGIGGASAPSNGDPNFMAPAVSRSNSPMNGPDGSCALTTATGEHVTVEKQVPVTTEVTTRTPVALYLMQDQSGSMLEPVLPPTKWNQTTDAITAFVNDPTSAGIDVAIQYFALATPACDGSVYNVPEVPLAPLPGNAANIINSLASKFPLTGTPIEPALRGVTKFCSDYNDQNPGKQCVAVLITDGQPSACNGDPAALAQIAADAKAQHKVITFTIGMDGADFTMLSGIARAGGSDCTPATTAQGDEACNVAGGGTSFIDALNTIRATVTTSETHLVTTTEVHSSKLACEFKLPAPPDGAKLDANKVNVQFTSDSGSEKIYHVASLADCAATTTKAWYYDDPQAPTKILACPNTCAVLQAVSGDGGVTTSLTAPRVDVLLGCKSEPPPA